MELPPRARPLASHARRAALIAWLTAALALLPHLRGLANGFVYDDFRFVAENRGIQTLDAPAGLLIDIDRMATPRDDDIWRPLRTLGFALEHAVGCRQGSGPHVCTSAFAFHATSLLLFLLLVRGLIALAQRVAGFPLGAACAGALLFGLHPLTVESVAWISSQGDLLAALGVVGCLLVAAERPLLAAGFAFAALLGKESALPLVGVLALEAWRGRRFRALPPALRPPGREATVAPLLVVAVAIGTGIYLLARQHLLSRAFDFGAIGFSQEDAPWTARALTALKNGLFALRLLFVPHPLSIDYDATSYEPAEFFGSTGLVLSAHALLLAGLCVVASRPAATRDRLLPPLLFALLFFAPTCGLLVVMKNPMADRYLLLPAAGGAFFLAGAVSLLMERLGGGRATRVAGGVLLAAASAGLGTLTYGRTALFRDDATLWHDELARRPASPNALLGSLRAADDRGDEATSRVLAAELARVVAPTDARACLAHLRLGQLAAARGEDEAAESEFATVRAALIARGSARGLDAELHVVFVGLANAARARGDIASAEARAKEGVGWFGRQPRLLESWGVARDLSGDPAGAAALYQEALAQRWETASLRYHFALAELHRGDRDRARAEARRALALDPQHRLARQLLDQLTP